MRPKISPPYNKHAKHLIYIGVNVSNIQQPAHRMKNTLLQIITASLAVAVYKNYINKPQRSLIWRARCFTPQVPKSLYAAFQPSPHRQTSKLQQGFTKGQIPLSPSPAAATTTGYSPLPTLLPQLPKATPHPLHLSVSSKTSFMQPLLVLFNYLVGTSYRCTSPMLIHPLPWQQGHSCILSMSINLPSFLYIQLSIFFPKIIFPL